MKQAIKLVILDRDGVINHARAAPIRTPDEWEPIVHSLDAIAYLNQYGFKVAVASNQSALAREGMTVQQLNAVHNKMYRQLQQAGAVIEGVWFCPHAQTDGCDCRKPKAGMLSDILQRLDAAPEHAWLVGDKARDMLAAQHAKIQPALVLTGQGKATLAQEKLPEHTQVFEDLWAFAQFAAAHVDQS